ncbi:hypothetical protein [Streptomyces nigrescens]|uniref:hypothetical protein n=1 Tax=Streptomyces nigrescens TaxID=1920 RepID=UPI0036F8AAE1
MPTPIQLEQQLYFELPCREAQKLIQDHYGIPYDLAQALGMSSGSCAVTITTGHACHPDHPELSPDDRTLEPTGLCPAIQEQVTLWRSLHAWGVPDAARAPHPGLLLSDLAHEGVIPAGRYLLHLDR